ncbi:MAG: fibronectin type III domain-containing protein [Xanthomonadales bacterium]|nr:fibronectin type III domain-containing protein [Xanthomonadales bacterium]
MKHTTCLLLLLGLMLSSPGWSQSVTALPNVVLPAQELTLNIRGLNPGARYVLDLYRAEPATSESLGTTPTGRDGAVTLSVTVPAVAPGPWQIRVLDFSGQVLATSDIRILEIPGIETNPGSAYPGEIVTVSGFGLTPGAAVDIRIDDLRVAGPLPVATSEDMFQVRMPASSSATDDPVGVLLTQTLDSLPAGDAAGTITRLARDVVAFGTPRFRGMPANIRLGETYSVEGSVEPPSGMDAASLEWTYAMVAEGVCLPVASALVEMQSNGDFQVLNARVGGLLDGIPANYLINPFDEHGLVFRNPVTGESDCLPAGGLNLGDEEAVPVRILVQNQQGEPIGGARVVLRQGLYSNPFRNAGAAKGLPAGGNLGLGAAHLFGENQFSDGAEKIAQGRCPATGTIQYTAETSFPEEGIFRGQAEFVLNPFRYVMIRAAAVATNDVDINTSVPVPAPLEYSVKVAALDKGYGYTTEEGCGTGLRFDLQVADNGFYLRNTSDGEFTVRHDPNTGPLVVTLPDFPSSGDLCFQSLPYVPGLPQVVRPAQVIEWEGQQVGMEIALGDKQESVFIGDVTTFPTLNASDFSVVAPARVEIEYDQALFGRLENTTLTLEGYPDPLPMSFQANGGACDIDGGILFAEIPDLHRFDPPADRELDGLIRGEIGFSGRFISKTFTLGLKEGPTWFKDPTQYEDVFMSWSADRVRIIGTEVMLMQDASTNSQASQDALAEYDVPPMNNDLGSQAVVDQTITAGTFGNRIRTADTAGQVNNRGAEPKSTVTDISQDDDGSGKARRLLKGGPTTCSHADDTPFPRPDALLDFGSCEPETIFETGAIPIFRYAWGIPPIAAATLGADIWFGVYFRYFGDVVASLQKISVNFTAEPIVQAGLDIFFDLSALFGVVSARVQASPVIGVSMPITVVDSLSANVEACFNFDLVLAYIASVGWCDFCVKAEDSISLFTIAEPSNCKVPGPNTKAGGGAPVNITRPAVAVSDLGMEWIAFETASGIRVEKRYGRNLISGFDLDSQPGAMRPKIAMLDDDTGIVVWTQTDLSNEDFLLIDGLTEFENASSQLHLVYAVYDANSDSFGPTLDLTAPNQGGDGAVTLDVCPPTQAGCGTQGRLLAAWEHDRAGNLAMHDIEVRWAEFDGLSETWTPVQAIDPGNVFKQVQPEALYHYGDAMVLWIENPAAGSGQYDMNQRKLRYRFPNLAAAQDAVGVPMSIASPDAVSHAGGDVLVAYTISGDSDRFVGARRRLHSAWGDCDMGICSWNDEVRLDSQNRALYVEQPSLAQGEDGRVTALFRYLSNSDVRETDPVGVKLGTGDLAKLELVAAGLTDPTPLTNDGRTNWGIQAVANPVTGDILIGGARGPALELDVLAAAGSTAKAHMPATKGVSGNGEVFVGSDSGLPDFAVLDAGTEAEALNPGGTIEVTVKVMNLGGAGKKPTLVASWDDPFEIPVLETTANIGPAGAMEWQTLTVPVPASFSLDEKRHLYLSVNRGPDFTDADGNNDTLRVSIGGLPVPQGLRVSSSRSSALVQVQWTPVEDPRVTGYTVYRRNPDGQVMMLGTTPTFGFLDTKAVSDRIYQYQVRSHSASLTESESSPWMEHYLQPLQVPESIFSNGFEG